MKKRMVFVLGTGIKVLKCKSPLLDKKGRKKPNTFSENPLCCEEKECRLRRLAMNKKHSCKFEGKSQRKKLDYDCRNEKLVIGKKKNKQNPIHLNTLTTLPSFEESQNQKLPKRKIIQSKFGRLKLNINKAGKIETAHFRIYS